MILLFVILSGFFCIQKAQAEESVVISEVCWMGSADSSSDEWIELYNNTSTDIDLDGWMLVSEDGQPEIALEGVILTQGYFLLERSDDESAPEATADQIYSGSMGNNGEILSLYDDDDNLIYRIDAIEGWMGGDNETKQTMVLVDGAWATSKDAGGSPGSVNYKLEIINYESEESDMEDEDNDNEKKEIQKEGKIIINEIYPNPVGLDRQKEFIELYNAGDVTVDLEGWKLESRGRTYEFGKFDIIYGTQMGRSIGPGGHFVIFRYQSGLVLNNSGGVVKLYKPNKKTAENTLKYSEAPEGYSYANSASIDIDNIISTSTKKFFLHSSLVGAWVWTSQISPGAGNQIKALNTAPQAIFSAPPVVEPQREIFFDASDTIDEEGDMLEFVWDFGDGVEVHSEEVSHTFLSPGNYEVALHVSDGRQESIFSKIIRVGIGEDDIYDNDILDEYYEEPYWYEDMNIPPLIFEAREASASGLSISDAKKQAGENIEIEGVVLAEPGIIGTQYFYVADDAAGIRVYNYKKEFPDIKEGDLVRVRGEIVEIRGEITLKTAGIEDMEVLENGQDLPINKISSEDIIKDNVGRLVEIDGHVNKKDLPRVFIEDTLGEAAIYIKSGLGIDTGDIKQDLELKILGILGIVSGDLVILPRRASDIEIKNFNDEQGRVMGESSQEHEAKEWDLPQRNSQGELLKYLAVLGVLGIVILAVYFYRRRSL